MRTLPALALAAALLAAGCGEDEHHYVANIGDGMTTPTMATRVRSSERRRMSAAQQDPQQDVPADGRRIGARIRPGEVTAN